MSKRSSVRISVNCHDSGNSHIVVKNFGLCRYAKVSIEQPFESFIFLAAPPKTRAGNLFSGLK
ncbi:MAG: hypothetical protein JW786_01235 [Desulfobacterales bacterium]|nr:hypothetical protein [Desulfobacterales bacterium]